MLRQNSNYINNQQQTDFQIDPQVISLPQISIFYGVHFTSKPIQFVSKNDAPYPNPII